MKSKPVIIIGAGGHARVVADILFLLKKDVIGFTDAYIKPGIDSYGNKILGSDSVINSYSSEEINLVNGIGAMPLTKTRWEIAEKYRELGYSFLTIVHPSAVISNKVALKEGVQIMASAVIQTGVSIGKDSIINTGSIIDHDCSISEKCHIAPGVVCSGCVDIKNRAHLGTGTIVKENISIGMNALIAAGSVVYKDIPDNTKLIQTK